MQVDMNALEGIVKPITARDIANKILSEGAERAARTIVALATSATSESVRLRAAQYVVEHVCGSGVEGVADPWDEFLKDITGVTQ